MLRSSLDERKRFLTETAERIFARNGYKTTSLQDIAGEAGISKAGIYHYFKTKEDILFHLIKVKHDKFVNVLRKSVQECEDKALGPEGTFKKLMYTYANYLNNEKDLRLIVLHDRHQLTGENRKRLHEIEQELFRTLKDQVRQIPNISKAYNTSLISFMIIAISHWLGSWLREGGDLSQEEAIKQMMEIILHGVLE